MISFDQFIASLNLSKNLVFIYISIFIVLGFFLALSIRFLRNKKRKTPEKPSSLEKTALSTLKVKKSKHYENPKEDLEQAKSSSMNQSLEKTSSNWIFAFKKIFKKSLVLDSELENKLYKQLISTDVGIKTANILIAQIKEKLKSKDVIGWDDVKKVLEEKMFAIFAKSQSQRKKDSLKVKPKNKPVIHFIVGVNGAGKTTTLAKLVSHYKEKESKTLLCAADTYRAAATEQLQVWADRLDVELISGKENSDPASIAYKGVTAPDAHKHDHIFIDTSGRLHNKDDLMAELAKIRKVVSKARPSSPQEVWLILDATTGQNAFQQVKKFHSAVGVTGLLVTKIDGTAKGGVILGLAHEFELPIHFLGTGEKQTDLQEFKPDQFIKSLLSTSA